MVIEMNEVSGRYYSKQFRQNRKSTEDEARSSCHQTRVMLQSQIYRSARGRSWLSKLKISELEALAILRKSLGRLRQFYLRYQPCYLY